LETERTQPLIALISTFQSKVFLNATSDERKHQGHGGHYQGDFLNPKLKLAEIVETSSLLGLADGGPGELGWWAVVSDHCVVAGGAVDMEQISKTLNR